jgi:hypothetical protein
VSVSFLYADAELARRIADARDRQNQAGRDRSWRLPARSLVTQASLRTDLANTKEHLRRLTDELRVLQARLAHDLGAGADLAGRQHRSPELDRLLERSGRLEVKGGHSPSTRTGAKRRPLTPVSEHRGKISMESKTPSS